MLFLLIVSDAERKQFQSYSYSLPSQLQSSGLFSFLTWWLWTTVHLKTGKEQHTYISLARRHASSIDSTVWLLAQGTVPPTFWARKSCICFLHLSLPSTIKSKNAADFDWKGWRWHRCTSNNLRYQDVILGDYPYLPFTVDRSWAISYLPKSSNKKYILTLHKAS